MIRLDALSNYYSQEHLFLATSYDKLLSTRNLFIKLNGTNKHNKTDQGNPQ